MAGHAKEPRGALAEVLTVAEVCEFLRIHPTTMYRLIRKRQIPVFRVGSDYRFNRAAIAEWCHAQEVGQSPPSSRRG